MRSVVSIVPTLLLVAAVNPLSADVEGAPCEGEPTDQLVEYGDVVLCAIDVVGDSDFFRFLGTAGETVVIQATERPPLGTDEPCIRVFDRDDTPVTAVICGSPARATLALPFPSGEYQVQVTERFDDQVLDYTMVIERVAPPSPAATELDSALGITGTLAPVGDLDVFFFNGAAGDTISVRVTDQSATTAEPCLELFDPEGTPLNVRQCSNTTEINMTLENSGAHAVLITERFDDQQFQFHIVYQCISGTCPATQRPVCDIEMTQDVYQEGDVVTIQSWRIANPGPTAASVELKGWLEIPTVPPVGILNVGADGSLVLPSGFDVDLGTIPLLPVTPSLPKGTWGLHCRVLAPVTGETLGLNLNPFEIE